MWKELKYYFLVKIYRILVVKVYTIDRAAMSTYHKFHTFCDLSFMTNNGQLSFSFKEDRRSSHACMPVLLAEHFKFDGQIKGVA